MAFHEVRLPTRYSYGSGGGPSFSTGITVSDSGHETRVARWSGPKHQYDLIEGIKSLDEIAELREFVIARNGAEHGFRLKDCNDFTSARNGVDTGGVKDVQIGVGDGATTTFQLIKKYTSGLITVSRSIAKPVAGTVQIWSGATLLTLGVHYTVDTTTGIVTFASAPALGVALWATYQFDVPGRFGEEVDNLLKVRRDDVEEGSISSLPVVEILDPAPAYTSFFYGGSVDYAVTADFTLSTGFGRTWVLTAAVAGKKAALPDPADIPDGKHIFDVLLEPGSQDIILTDHNGDALLTLSAGEGATCALATDGDDVRVWYAY